MLIYHLVRPFPLILFKGLVRSQWEPKKFQAFYLAADARRLGSLSCRQFRFSSPGADRITHCYTARYAIAGC